MIKGKYYNEKILKENYSEELKECIEKTCQYSIDTTLLKSVEMDKEKRNHPIMMLGKIQSGKTRAFTGVMALAFDNGFDMVFILTKNSKALVDQTRKRMRTEFREAIRENEVEVFDIIKINDGLTDYELDKKVIIVAKKEKSNLDRISKFISDYTINQSRFCLVIDDEADTTGIGFDKVKDSEDEFDLRKVSARVNAIRGSLDGCVFIQVTATPYALYLQPDFNEEKIEPIKPQKTILVPSGDGYIGGEYYFLKSKKDDHPAQYIFEAVSEEENELVSNQKRKGKKSKIEDRRRFKQEDILICRDKLFMFKKGLINFIVGGCFLRMKNPKSHFSYIIHTATQKSSHIQLEEIAKEFFEQIKNRDNETSPLIEEMLYQSVEDVTKSIVAYGFEKPKYEEIQKSFYNAIDRGYIKITTVNSDKDMQEILDEENGELKLSAPFSIFVGGQILDRGVTIPKMIGFYYGRNPITMQQDTVMQHSRMFGYRGIDLLSVTRFYTTKRIYENMTRITEIDTALRDSINLDSNNGIRFIQQYIGRRVDSDGEKIKDAIIPCSPSKIALSNIVLLKASSRLLPVGFNPIAKTYGAKISTSINNKLSKLIGRENKGAVLAPISDIEELLESAFSGIIQEEGAARFISKDHFIATLRYLAGEDKMVYIIVRRNRKIAKYKGNGSIYQDAPDTKKDELHIASNIAIDKPALILIHQDGSAEGWNGCEFWWPILYVQLNTPMTVFAMSLAGGRIK